MRGNAALGLPVVLVLLTAGPAWAGDGPLGGSQAPVVTTTSGGDTAGVAATTSDPGGDGPLAAGGQAGGGAPGAEPAAVRPRVERQTVQVPGPCPATPGNPAPRLLQDQTRVPPGPWLSGATYCEGDPVPVPAPVIDPEVIRGTAAAVRATVRAPRPAVVVQPPGGALVSQPAVFSVGDPGPPPSASDTDELSTLTVTVRLGAPTYTWDFGDGAVRSGLTSRGRAYRSGDDVPREGSGELISHTFSAAGAPTVTVTAVYPVTYGAGPVSGSLAPLTARSTAQLRVRSARSELVSR